MEKEQICSNCQWFIPIDNTNITDVFYGKDMGICWALPPIQLSRDNRRRWLRPEVDKNDKACSLWK